MTKSLKILFVARDAAYLHYYHSTIQALCERGHRMIFLYDKHWTKKESSIENLKNFECEFPNFTYRKAVKKPYFGKKLLFHTRQILSYRRYIVQKGRKQSIYYIKRHKGYLPHKLQELLEYGWVNAVLKAKIIGGVLKLIEKAIPPDKNITAHIKKLAPDIVITTPVTMRFSSADIEYLKAAKALKLPTVLPVISWDNLTTKNIIHIKPDLLLAWNKEQAREAEQGHNIPRKSIKITGSPVFDVWFSKLKPSTTRKEFCAQHGLLKADSIITYLGSSHDQAADETWLLKELRTKLDSASDPELQKVQIVARPHPGNLKIYQKTRLKNLIIVPKQGTLPNTKENLQLFYDTLYHSVAVVMGVNTSAIIDAMIVGKPGVIILTHQYYDTQIQTLHFQQLMRENAVEFINGTETFPEIVRRIKAGEDKYKNKRERFVKEYIRPRGLQKTAGEIQADEIETFTPSFGAEV